MKCTGTPWRCALLTIIPLLGCGASALAQTAPPAQDPVQSPPSSGLFAPAAISAPSSEWYVPSLGRLFEDSVGDFKRLPSLDSLKWLTIGAMGALAGHPADASLTRSLSSAEQLHEPFEPGMIIGSTPFQMGAAFATYALARTTNHPRVARVGADLFQAQLVAQTTTFALKFSVRRTRPDHSNYSFPSGHTAVSFASATVLQRHFGWKAGIPAYAVASYVATSRLQANRHYLSDVAFGAALGIIAGRTVTVGRGNTRLAVAPIATPGGGGIGFTWIGNR